MSNPPTVPIIGPDGATYDIPRDRISDAVSQGGKLAMDIVGPDKHTYAIPLDNVHRALAQGGILKPPPMPAAPVAQELQQPAGDTSIIGRYIEGVKSQVPRWAGHPFDPSEAMARYSAPEAHAMPSWDELKAAFEASPVGMAIHGNLAGALGAATPGAVMAAAAVKGGPPEQTALKYGPPPEGGLAPAPEAPPSGTTLVGTLAKDPIIRKAVIGTISPRIQRALEGIQRGREIYGKIQDAVNAPEETAPAAPAPAPTPAELRATAPERGAAIQQTQADIDATMAQRRAAARAGAAPTPPPIPYTPPAEAAPAEAAPRPAAAQLVEVRQRPDYAAGRTENLGYGRPVSKADFLDGTVPAGAALNSWMGSSTGVGASALNSAANEIVAGTPTSALANDLAARLESRKPGTITLYRGVGGEREPVPVDRVSSWTSDPEKAARFGNVVEAKIPNRWILATPEELASKEGEHAVLWDAPPAKPPAAPASALTQQLRQSLEQTPAPEQQAPWGGQFAATKAPETAAPTAPQVEQMRQSVKDFIEQAIPYKDYPAINKRAEAHVLHQLELGNVDEAQAKLDKYVASTGRAARSEQQATDWAATDRITQAKVSQGKNPSFGKKMAAQQAKTNQNPAGFRDAFQQFMEQNAMAAETK